MFKDNGFVVGLLVVVVIFAFVSYRLDIDWAPVLEQLTVLVQFIR